MVKEREKGEEREDERRREREKTTKKSEREKKRERKKEKKEKEKAESQKFFSKSDNRLASQIVRIIPGTLYLVSSLVRKQAPS